MRTIFILFYFIMSLANICQAQWVTTNYPKSINIIDDHLKYSSGNKIWGIGFDLNQIFLKYVTTSNDGGLTWQSYSDNDFMNIISFVPISDNEAYVSTDKLFHTTDGGVTWSEKNTPDSAYLGSNNLVSFMAFDSIHFCLLTGRNNFGCNEIWVTDNAGNSWTKVDCANINNSRLVTGRFFEQFQIDSIASFRISNFVFSTKNFGKTWQIDSNANRFNWTLPLNHSTYLSTKTFGTAPNISTIFYRSNNQGVSWDSVTTIPSAYNRGSVFQRLQSSTGRRILLANSTGLIKSDNDGLTWDRVDNENYTIVRFYDNENGIAYTRISSTENQVLRFIGPFTSIGQDPNQTTSPSFLFFPNPVNDQLNLVYKTLDSETEFIITDLTGKTIKSFKVNNVSQENTITMNTSDMEKGIYFINAANLGCFKLIKN